MPRTEIVQVLGEEAACEEARQVIQALMVLVNRGMTVGTPDVVTAISMVKNDEIDKFVALYEEEIIKDNTGNLFVSKPKDPTIIPTMRPTMIPRPTWDNIVLEAKGKISFLGA